MNTLIEEPDLLMSADKRLLKFIHDNDIKAIKDTKPHLRDLNFLEEFNELEIDSRVTPLIVASHLGKIEIVKLLLQNENIDINLGSHDLQLTALCVACSAGNYEVVETLISNGADVDKADILGRSPLSLCFTRLQEDTNVFENNLICMKMATLLLQSGSDVNFIINREKGRTLLMQYCATDMDMTNREKEANLKVIRFLLEHGADSLKKSKKGKTALDYSHRHPFKNDVQRLLLTTHQMHFHKAAKGAVTISSFYKVKKYEMFSTEGAANSVCCSIFGSCR